LKFDKDSVKQLDFMFRVHNEVKMTAMKAHKTPMYSHNVPQHANANRVMIQPYVGDIRSTTAFELDPNPYPGDDLYEIRKPRDLSIAHLQA